MESTSSAALYIGIISFGISLTILICFFILCTNVSKIKKSILTDADEYSICKSMGDKDKAYYHLQRDFLLKDKVMLSQYEIERYFNQFKELQCGIPDFEQFKKLS